MLPMPMLSDRCLLFWAGFESVRTMGVYSAEKNAEAGVRGLMGIGFSLC